MAFDVVKAGDELVRELCVDGLLIGDRDQTVVTCGKSHLIYCFLQLGKTVTHGVAGYPRGDDVGNARRDVEAGDLD